MKKIKHFIEKFPKRLIKRLLGIFAVCGLSLAVFSPNVCYAESTTEQSDLLSQEEFTRNIRSFVNMVSQIVYVFIWPLLVIAGAALDNSLIYGKFLHLDAALWDIWNIMKNIANFSLWFIFIFAIVKNLFKSSFWEWNPIQDAGKVIKSTLVAGVLVQMSWFILGALLDLSTTLIVSVWGLPLSMLWSYDKETASVPIMQLHTKIDENDWWDIMMYYSYWQYNFAPCMVIDNDDEWSNIKLNWYKWKYIAWRKILYLSRDVEFVSGYCTLYGYPYKYIESPDIFCEQWGGGDYCYEKSWEKLSEMNAHYTKNLKNYITQLDTWAIAQQISWCFLMSAYGSELVGSGWICSGMWALDFTGDIFAKFDNKLATLMEDSKWWVWPLVTMYSSILRVQELLVKQSSDSTMSSLFWAVINTLFVLVLFIPIAILAILLIIRVWFLWVVIALSPILVLVSFWPEPLNKLKDKDFFKKFTLEEIMKKIFAPVVVVFAVGVCIIFLVTIKAAQPVKDSTELLSSFWVQQHDCNWHGLVAEEGGWWWEGGAGSSPESDTWANKSDENCKYLVWWLVDLDINLSWFGHEKDVFVRCLMMLLSVWIVRFFLKFAIWMMWDKGKTLMESAEKFIWSIPVIPLGKHWSIGINKIGELAPSKRLERLASKMDNQSDAVLRERFPWAYWDKDESEDSDTKTKEVNTIIEKVRTGEVAAYNDLSEDEKKTLDNYYWSNEAATNVINNITNNITQYNKDGVSEKIWNAYKTMKETWHKNSDALHMSRTQLDMAVQNDKDWKERASGMIWWAVHTEDGVFIVDVVKGTELQNPLYRIVTREEYEENHFWKAIPSVSSAQFNDWKEKQNMNDKYMKDYLDKLEKEYKEFKESSGNENKSKSEETMMNQSKRLFTEEFKSILEKLAPDKFKQEWTN